MTSQKPKKLKNNLIILNYKVLLLRELKKKVYRIKCYYFF